MQQSSWVPFYPYTMFQNPISRSSSKMQKTLITQKVLVTQSSNIVHCNWHTQKPTCADLQAFWNTFSCSSWICFHFLSGGVKETAKISLFVDFVVSLTPLTKNEKQIQLEQGKSVPKGLQICTCRFLGMPIACTMLELCVTSTFWVIKVFLHFTGRSRYRGSETWCRGRMGPKEDCCICPIPF